MVRALYRFNTEIDVTQVLPVIGVPTLVLHRTDDLVPVEYGRYVAEHVPGARFVELAGNDHMPWIGDSDAVLDEVEQFLTGGRRGAEPDRVLATVLFTTSRGLPCGRESSAIGAGPSSSRRTTVESARSSPAMAAARWTRPATAFSPRSTGPTRAIRCAEEITGGREVRRGSAGQSGAGVHTGEIVLAGDERVGIAVHVGARIAAMASRRVRCSCRAR